MGDKMGDGVMSSEPVAPPVGRLRTIRNAAVRLVLSLLGFLIAIAIIGGTAEDSPNFSIGFGVAGALLAVYCFWRRKGVWRWAGGILAAIVCLLGVGMGVDYRDPDKVAQVRAARAEQEKVAAAEKAKVEKIAADAEAERKAKAEAERLRAEAERAEQAKREAAEMVALRKTDADEYLRRLRAKDSVKWVQELQLLRPKEYAAYLVELQRQKDAEEVARQRKSPRDFLSLEYSWSKGGFDQVFIGNFTIKSSLAFAVHDVSIACLTTGNSGTKLSGVAKTLYEIIPAKSTRRFTNVNMGLIDSQSAGADCKIIAVVAD